MNGSETDSWVDRARAGDAEFVDRLLSRPNPDIETAPYWEAFQYITRDRTLLSLSLGMGGGLVLPQKIPREAIRRHGQALRLSGEELVDFVEIVAGIDDFWVVTEQRRQADAAVRAARAQIGKQ